MPRQLINYFILWIVRYSPILVPLVLVLIDIFAKKELGEKRCKKQSTLFILPQRFCLCGVSFYAWLLIAVTKEHIIIEAFRDVKQMESIIFCLVFLLLHFAFYEWCVNLSHKIGHLPFSYAFAFISLAFPFLLL